MIRSACYVWRIYERQILFGIVLIKETRSSLGNGATVQKYSVTVKILQSESNVCAYNIIGL